MRLLGMQNYNILLFIINNLSMLCSESLTKFQCFFNVRGGGEGLARSCRLQYLALKGQSHEIFGQNFKVTFEF